MSAMKEKVTPHLRSLIQDGNEAITSQFLASTADSEGKSIFTTDDPLQEEEHTAVKGLVHKYGNRVLWKVSYRCAAHCRFCTRLRQIGTADGDLGLEDIDRGIDYISEHSEINEVILSGGDPFFTPNETEKIFDRLIEIPSVSVIRIGTRMPVHLPSAFSKNFLSGLLGKIGSVAFQRPIYVLIHVNHVDEVTKEVRSVIEQLRRLGVILLSQTVFLKGVNDSERNLKNLFETLYRLGMVPYYIFRCDYVSGLERFVCDIRDERRIMTNLRRELSGLAVPTYVVDVPGRGKIPVPLEFWSGVDLSGCMDFDGQRVLI